MLTVRKILFVCKDKYNSIPHFSVVDNSMQLLSGLIYTVSISTVYNKDEALSSCVIMAPQRSYLILASNILRIRKRKIYMINIILSSSSGTLSC